MARAKPVDMLDVRKIPWQKKRDYLTLVAAVAASDGALHPDELALLERWMAQFSLAEKSRQVVLAAAKQESLSLEAIKRRLAKTDLVYSLMLDMLGMAMADGVLMDEEKIDQLQAVVRKTYRDRLSAADLADPVFAAECRTAREALLDALGLSDLV